MRTGYLLLVLCLSPLPATAASSGWSGAMEGLGQGMSEAGSRWADQADREALERQRYEYQRQLMERQHQLEMQRMRAQQAPAVSSDVPRHCISVKARVGARLRLSNGDTGTVQRIVGASPQCTNPEFPLHAVVALD